MFRFCGPLSGCKKRKLGWRRARVHGRWEKGGEKPRSCFITKAADIKFHRQTSEFPRVRDTSVFTTFVCDRRSDETRTFPLRKYARKTKLRLPKERRGSVLQVVKAKNHMLDTGGPLEFFWKRNGKTRTLWEPRTTNPACCNLQPPVSRRA